MTDQLAIVRPRLETEVASFATKLVERDASGIHTSRYFTTAVYLATQGDAHDFSRTFEVVREFVERHPHLTKKVPTLARHFGERADDVIEHETAEAVLARSVAMDCHDTGLHRLRAEAVAGQALERLLSSFADRVSAPLTAPSFVVVDKRGARPHGGFQL